MLTKRRYLPFGLDGGKAARNFAALLFLELLRGTSRMEPVGKLPFTVRKGFESALIEKSIKERPLRLIEKGFDREKFDKESLIKR